MDDLVQKVSRLVNEYSADGNRVDMLKPLTAGSTLRCMDKVGVSQMWLGFELIKSCHKLYGIYYAKSLSNVWW